MSSKPFGTPAQDLLDDGQIEEPTIHYKIKKKRKTMKEMWVIQALIMRQNGIGNAVN